jgi:hypothetical protein
MSFTVLIGWWLAPCLVTVAASTWAGWAGDHSSSSGYGNIGKGLGNALIFGVALVASLIAWLIWALAA